MADKITLYGTVSDLALKPIFMIRVTAFQDEIEVAREYTGQDGKYTFTVPNGRRITLSFDTHATLTNARDWHPSMVSNIEAVGDSNGYIRQDRALMKVGTGGSVAVCVDVLAAYLFGLMRADEARDREYAKEAEARLSSMKVPSPALDRMRSAIAEQFSQLARG